MRISDMTSQQGAARSRPLTVSQALQTAKQSLEFITVSLIGEVSEVNAKPGYKAVYFTVKDDGASLPCMMWLNRYRSSGVRFRVGQRVELTGRFTLYAPKGRMNFDVFSASAAGEGDLRRQVAQRARLLQDEGLMDAARKRAVGRCYEHIGVVTSPRGAVVYDVMRTMRRRFPLTLLSVAGVAVEGKDAPAAMIEALQTCVAAGCQAVLLVRGGGSFEDLMPFNDESLARAIAACPIPVVTGIGHEPDTTIADMVSDFRASTPTAAAERVTPDADALAGDIAARKRALDTAADRVLDRFGGMLDRYAARPALRDPRSMLATDLMTLDAMHDRLERVLHDGLRRDAQRLDSIEGRLRRTGLDAIAPFDHAIALRAGRLHDLSPLAVLARGYAVARDERGRVISSVHAVEAGEHIEVSVSDGSLRCTVDCRAADRAAE
ncbi:MAG: exodeoxyribonuclease VII large subunit [Slackia sp.]|nr:exodeoxyribonuclease VII large subunit [Slackia sp.]